MSCLMSAVTLFYGMRQLMYARRGMGQGRGWGWGVCFVCRVLPISCFVFQILRFSDTDENKIRNAYLSLNLV